MSAPGSDRGSGPLRRRVARGTMVNGAFLAVVNGLNVVRGLALAAFLAAAEYGVWGIVSAALALLLAFRRAGTADRFVQQDAGDQRLAFQRAITLELALAGALLVLALLLFPGLAALYGREELVLPGIVAALALPGLALQAPLNVFYRRLDFRRQRTLQAVDPVVALVVTLGLAAAGAGYWAPVAGLVAGAWTAAAVALAACPYPIRWRWDRASARDYAGFSWPLMAGGLMAGLMGQALLLAGEARLGLAGAGFIALSHTVSQYARRVDEIVTTTLYPAICAVRDRTEVLRESFLTSNRLAILYGVPFGLGLALFAEPFTVHVLGDEWRPAVVLLQAVGIMAAAHQIGFNWDAFVRARGDTRPIAWATAWGVLSFLAAPLPLMLAFGLEGLAAGFLVMEAASIAVRAHFIHRLFPGIRLGRHAARAMLPTAPAVAAVLALRAAEGGSTSGLQSLGEAALYVAVVAVATVVLERRLVREVVAYLRPAGAA